MLLVFSLGFVVCLAVVGAARQPPNIVIILADDMGWNDVGFHGSDQIPTPNIDALAYNGIILNQHYTPALCTPSRAALLTGKYPIHTGMQHLVILEAEPWGLGLSEKILPEVLTEAGYVSHAVGKWHLGFFKPEYTPTKRGFASHFGYWQGFHDYYNHSVRATYDPYDGYDMRRNLETDWSSLGQYSTDLFTEESVRLIKEHDKSNPLFLYLAHLAPHTGNMRDPFQAPDEVIAKFSHIEDPERRVYAAMVSKLDESVGEVIAALKSRDMLDNSVILFMSDNGAPTHGIHSNRGSNYPLRGIKNSAWEGGVRNIAAIWSPLLKKQQRVSNQMMYISDWLPTLAALAGLDVKKLGKLDGIDMWTSLSEDLESPRTEFVYNIDDVDSPYAAIRMGDWKYISGSPTGERNSGWYGEAGRDLDIGYDTQSILLSKAGVAISAFMIKQQIQQKIRQAASINSVLNDEKEMREWRLLNKTIMLDLRRDAEIHCSVNNTELEVECNPMVEPCLFNIRTDPCELNNIASRNVHVLNIMKERVQRYRQGMVKARNLPLDPNANPIFWNQTWSSWIGEVDSRKKDMLDLSESLKNLVYLSGFFSLILGIFLFIFIRQPETTKQPLKKLSVPTISIFNIHTAFKAAEEKESASNVK